MSSNPNDQQDDNLYGKDDLNWQKDQDEKKSQQSYSAATEEIRLDSLDPRLRNALKPFDVKGDGTVSLKEINEAAGYFKSEQRSSSRRHSLGKQLSETLKGENVIDLNLIPDDNAKLALAVFDFDGDGMVDESELRRAAESHETVLKGRKYAIWALTGVVLFTIFITGALSLAVYFIVGSMKDTAVDPTTGAMKVKNEDVPVNVESHGMTFLPDVMTDPETETSIVCVRYDQAADMFQSTVAGVNGRFVETEEWTGDITVKDIGSSNVNDEHGTMWTDDEIYMGDIVLTPSAECTTAYAAAASRMLYPDEEVNSRRKLSRGEMLENHRALRDRVVGSLFNGGGYNNNNNNRRLNQHDERDIILQWFKKNSL
jgi:Ca2+-binding EF-hand superfamily protein